MIKKSKGPRPQRIERIAKKLAARYERQYSLEGKRKRPLRRTESSVRERPLIAYDLETTLIEAGSPIPLYVTAFSSDLDFKISQAVRAENHGMTHLAEILTERFLLPELNGARFVAWNGNRFDGYLIGAALLHRPEFIIRPYLTRGKALRGFRVSLKPQFFPSGYKKKSLGWEFLDGMAMTGIVKTLKVFLKTFAPEYQKIEGPDFKAGETFDVTNPEHVLYAERDSEGLYYGLQAAQKILVSTFNVPLMPTIGNTGIRIFQAHVPWDVCCWAPTLQISKVVRNVVMRGGYVYAKRYQGPIWKYDLNQAYAAAMRDAWLPGSSCIHYPKVNGFKPMFPCAIYRVRATHESNTVPFYYTVEATGLRANGIREIEETWLTSNEVEQLDHEDWKITYSDMWYWGDHFTMKEYVDKLEKLRYESPGGPNGAQGTMVKMIGNNSYGKTLEELSALDMVMALECPPGYYEYQAENDELKFIWFNFQAPSFKAYHQPQLGAFITAHIRMVVRRAALLNPACFVYADTDCVAFSRKVPLHCDPLKYGLWKCEVSGDKYRIIGKKIYASLETIKNADGDMENKSKTAKGLNVSRLTPADFAAWYAGNPPEQEQVQRQNFIKVMTGSDMFVNRTRQGTGVGSLAK